MDIASGILDICEDALTYSFVGLLGILSYFPRILMDSKSIR